jgi:hypothetical protein
VVASYAQAQELADDQRSIVEQVGLLGGHEPAAALAEARVLFEEGDLIGASDLSTQTHDRLRQAGQDGLVRLASAVVVLVALGVLAVSASRRRRRADAARYTAGP